MELSGDRSLLPQKLKGTILESGQKHSFIVKRCEDIPDIVWKAFHIASTGRPGPVVIDVPKDTTDPEITAPYRGCSRPGRASSSLEKPAEQRTASPRATNGSRLDPSPTDAERPR